MGSGPNGLAAAVTCARAGLRVQVLEAQPTISSSARTLDLGLADGIVHDICSAVHPMAWASPFFAEFDLRARGVELLRPDVSFAQPLPTAGRGSPTDPSTARSRGLGVDGGAWRSLVGRLAEHHEHTVAVALGDKRSIPSGLLPRGFGTAAAFGLAVLEQGTARGTGGSSTRSRRRC